MEMPASQSHGNDRDPDAGYGCSCGRSHSRRRSTGQSRDRRCSRRTLLTTATATATVAVGGLTLTAGCLTDEESTGDGPAGGDGSGTSGDGSGTNDDGSGNPTHDDGLAFFEEYLETEGVDVTALAADGTTVELTYATDRTTDQELGDEIGTIAGGYVLAGDHGLETGRLEATITDGERPLATWHIRETWVEQFEAGELSPGELTTNVLNSVELVEEG